MPSAPEKRGCTFEGWYKDSALTERFIFGSSGDKVTRNITLHAKWIETDKIRAEAALGKLYVGYKAGDNERSVTGNLTLPSSVNVSGDTINVVWSSNTPEVISSDGAVTRADSDVTVRLTAKVYSGTVTRTRNFYVVVLRAPSPAPIIDPTPIISPDPVPSACTVTFDTDGGSTIEAQTIEPGGKASVPDEPVKGSFYFMGWYPEKGFSFLYDFSAPVSKDITLYAKWRDTSDTSDSDGDGMPDSLEITFGTDPYDSDTDYDGLTDWEEVNWLNYNPLAEDTDGNGILDCDEDADGDGISNADESSYGTNMIVKDTDHDRLSDYDEAEIYGTDPANFDTDGDGVDDGTEVAIGSDPLGYDETFATTLGTNNITSNPKAIDISVTMNSGAENAGSLRIKPSDRSDSYIVSRYMPGFLAAYTLSADGEFDSAEITFTLGSEAGTISDKFKPKIYYLNEEAGRLEEVKGQTIDTQARTITAEVPHFSVYVLLNSVEFERVWSDDIRPPVPESSDAVIDIVFVIDYSYSMTWNDPGQKFKTLSKNFVSKLRDNKDRGAVVKFIRVASVVSELTTDKETLNNAIDSITYDDTSSPYSGTNGSEGLNSALVMLEASSSDYKYVIFLTDGNDTYRTYSYSYDDLIDRAKTAGVIIYSIGMGTAKEDLLKKVASETQGKYYHATASENSGELLNLEDVYRDIESETINTTSDDNDDGITNYYTNLMNEGRLTLCTGEAIFINSVNNTSPDWDGDGLLNGDEIEIFSDDKHMYVIMHSNPLFKDSDGDGFSDYNEVKVMHTSPMKYTISGDETYSLMNDGNFPQLYRDFSSGEQWVQDAFNWNKTDQAEKLFIDYFSDYASSRDMASRSSEAVATRMRYVDAMDRISLVSNIIKCAMSYASFAFSLGSGEYSERGRTADEMKRIQDSYEASQNVVNTLTKGKNLDIQAINRYTQSLADATFYADEHLEEADNILNAFAQCKDFMDILEGNKEFLSETARKDLKSGDIIVESITMTFDFMGSLFSAASIINCPFSWEHASKASDFLNETTGGQMLGGVFSVAIDLLDAAHDLNEVYATYGKIAVNYIEYQKYIELLRRIERHSQLDYIRDGASNITDIFNTACNMPDWQRFNSKVEEAKNKVLLLSELKVIWDVATVTADVLGFPYLRLLDMAVSIVQTVFEATGAYQKAVTIVDARVYYSIFQAASMLFTESASFSKGYFEAEGDKGTAIKYLVQMAQARIAGLDAVKKYIVSFKLEELMRDVGESIIRSNLILRMIYDAYHTLAGKKSEAEVKAEYDEAISGVYETMKKLQKEIKEELSPGLPDYEEYFLK